MEASTDAQLVGLVGGGDRTALAALYGRHVRAVFRFALSELRSREDAEDLTHEVFLILSIRAARITLTTESALPWLLVTCRNLCRNRRRALIREAQRRIPLDADIPATGDIEDAVALRELREAVRAALDALGRDDRRLFELCIEEGVSYQRAADLLGLSHSGVRNRLFRLRNRMRRTLATTREAHER